MKVIVLSEHGIEEAFLGLSLSRNQSVERMKEIAVKKAFGESGEAKFLEFIYIWIDVTAPRYWWQEADTYRLSSKQSESTMYSLCKSKLTLDRFEYNEYTKDIIEEQIESLNKLIFQYSECKESDIRKKLKLAIKQALPESFLQRRIWCMNYKTLQNIYNQRKNHFLPEWRIFLRSVLDGISYPELITGPIN